MENNELEIEFNEKKYKVELELDNQTNINLDECLKALKSEELFDYLYNYHMELFEDVNDDPYFDGKTILSGNDLKNSIEEITRIAYREGVIYVCGEYWCDPEHGFSITFPNGKFIKSQHESFDYDRDKGIEADYIPVCTILGEFSDYL